MIIHENSHAATTLVCVQKHSHTHARTMRDRRVLHPLLYSQSCIPDSLPRFPTTANFQDYARPEPETRTFFQDNMGGCMASSSDFTKLLAGSWIEIGAAGTWTADQMECWCYRQRFYSIYLKASFSVDIAKVRKKNPCLQPWPGRRYRSFHADYRKATLTTM